MAAAGVDPDEDGEEADGALGALAVGLGVDELLLPDGVEVALDPGAVGGETTGAALAAVAALDVGVGDAAVVEALGAADVEGLVPED